MTGSLRSGTPFAPFALIANTSEPAHIADARTARIACAMAAGLLASQAHDASPLVSDLAVIATKAGRTAARIVANALAAVHARDLAAG